MTLLEKEENNILSVLQAAFKSEKPFMDIHLPTDDGKWDENLPDAATSEGGPADSGLGTRNDGDGSEQSESQSNGKKGGTTRSYTGHKLLAISLGVAIAVFLSLGIPRC